MGRLTTHVLDLARGCPASGLTIELWAVEPETERRKLLRTVRTNADGRTDEPLLAGEDFRAGTYELVFAVGEYFKGFPTASAPPFFDRVPVRFTVSDSSQHYHVPLLVSPWAYSTYRGS